MNAVEQHLVERLHDMVDGELDSTPPTQQLFERGRLARRRRVVAATSASCAALVVVAAVAVAAVASAPARPTVSVQAASPQLELAAVITASESTSYKLKVTTRTAVPAPKNITDTHVTVGAFDPATITGYLCELNADSNCLHEQRLIEGVMFDRSLVSKWKQWPGKQARLAYVYGLDGAISASADPDELLKALRGADAKITKVNANTYHFEIVLQPPKPSGASSSKPIVTYTGDLVVDAAAQHIAKVTFEVTERGDSTATSPTQVTLEFSDYGSPVPVERPTSL
jgi:hypothetical protein